MAITTGFPESHEKTVFNAAMDKIKGVTNGEQEDLTVDFNKSTRIGKHECPGSFAEHLEHIMKSLGTDHGMHKTESGPNFDGYRE